ncbi:MAG: DNA-binding domain-containing protein [Defluviicoccus sp.]|nr:DNA-binding domain-containing protein [Defluviicoccus sp.]MDE0382269.1 DNA-binding domain-containing protein [Defluviicoccus sp.]
MKLASIQAEFAAALGDPAPDAAPAGLSGPARRRFRVYRNNVRVALIEALTAAYPALRRIVGERFFEAMALTYASGRPSAARTLNLYGAGFAGFVANFPPARDLPYLADVARLERAVLESLHAADAPALDPAALAALGAGVGTVRLAPHPATRLVRSSWPIARIWQANAGDLPSGEELVIAADAGGALVVRPALSVRVEAFDPAGCAFAGTLLSGGDPMTAAADAAALDGDFDVVPAFRNLLASGAFAGLAGATGEGAEA